ncbi:MAG: hypothetical protein EBR82_28740 [Caulobacteraceae bacterium]|nr:hypothetical protein [Caulobacteraceae bacterium]
MVYGTDASDKKRAKIAEIRGSTAMRRNASSTIERTDRFINIDTGIIPFRYSNYVKNLSTLDVRDAIILCQKAYYNVAIFRNTIDLMTEFSDSPIYLTGGSQKSREFFEAYFKKINLASFQDQFFREYYRSGNVFTYRFDTSLTSEQLLKITQTFGSKLKSIAQDGSVKLPARYTIINPADIYVGGTVNYAFNVYYKLLSDYELERLRDPKTDEDIEVYNNLPQDVKDKIKSKNNSYILVPLDKTKLAAVFYKKQDYEPLSIPMGFPVLDDINWKLEMKKMDMAVTRTMQQAVLLVTMGDSPDKGGVNQKNLQAMQQLFENQSIGRVLIADYTTKAQFVIPDIGNLIGPQKYEVVDRDIQIGLNNILIGNEKFANTSIKVQVFVQRLKQAREVFINEFLIPEIRRMSKDIGFKNFPTPTFQDIDIKDDVQYSRIYNRLVELGVLTAEEGLAAIETGRLPTQEESIESQRKFKELRDEGLYQPLIGGSAAGQAGRPSGSSGIPQSTKNVKPIGTKASFSVVKIKDNILASQNLEEEVKSAVRKKFNVKKLSNQQKENAEKISEIIIANETPENWTAKIQEYIEKPFDQNEEQINNIQEIAAEHQVTNYLASLLYHSKA